MIITAAELRSGDQIVTDSDTLLVDVVDIIGDGGLPHQGATVRITGRITKGWGRSLTRQLTWTKYADQEVDIIRAGVNEEAWQFDSFGRARRVR